MNVPFKKDSWWLIGFRFIYNLVCASHALCASGKSALICKPPVLCSWHPAYRSSWNHISTSKTETFFDQWELQSHILICIFTNQSVAPFWSIRIVLLDQSNYENLESSFTWGWTNERPSGDISVYKLAPLWLGDHTCSFY